MVLSRKSCPVPFEQQPLEEYNSLILSDFFSLPAKNFKFYFSFLFFLSFSITCLINLLFLPSKLFYYLDSELIITILIVADFFVSLFITRLYFSWSYISKRLLSAIVFYEESGWYDGQIWVKTTDVLIQDRLIAMNVCLPLINRIKVSMLIFVIKILIEIVFYMYS
nr:Ycf36 [Sahlingia subintegra]